MKSIKTPGMEFNHPSTNISYGKTKDNRCSASVWKPTIKERFQILLGANILTQFYMNTPHPENFDVRISTKKEIK